MYELYRFSDTLVVVSVNMFFNQIIGFLKKSSRLVPLDTLYFQYGKEVISHHIVMRISFL